MHSTCAADVARRKLCVAVTTTQHHWDHLRRCDHTAYSLPCGACEGVGSIASSDIAFDIKIFPRKIEASTVNPLRPIWGGPFTELASREILIAIKSVCLFWRDRRRGPKDSLGGSFSTELRQSNCSASPKQLCTAALTVFPTLTTVSHVRMLARTAAFSASLASGGKVHTYITM